MSSPFHQQDQDSFQNFIGNLKIAQAQYSKAEEDTLRQHQRKQMKALMALEKQFTTALQRHKWGNNVYKDFIKYICDTRRNILDARPYFRERGVTFTNFLSSAFKERKEKKIYTYRMNYLFVQWVLKQRKWHPNSPIVQIANKIKVLRDEIVQSNLPLAISQARMFYNATPRGHLAFMDLVQIHAQGLSLAIDKFAPVDDSGMSEKESLAVYKSLLDVALGIMTRDRVNNYSATMVHLYPPDKQKLYWCNKLRKHFPNGIDMEQMAVMVNGRLAEGLSTNAYELSNLLAGTNFMSSDTPIEENGDTTNGDTIGDHFEAKEDTRPDVRMEEAESIDRVRMAAYGLNIREQKMLRLKGVKL